MATEDISKFSAVVELEARLPAEEKAPREVTVPPPGRKMGKQEAQAHVFAKWAEALRMLAQ